jgi:hypothetical protein
VDKRSILIQLDTDPQPSVFDRIVALDAGVEEVLSYASVQPNQVRDLVHGAIFTRHPKDLKRTALFIGGSDLAAGEQLLAEACQAMLPRIGLQVSVLLDSNGANTTAAATVQVAGRHLDLGQARALVLGGTGPVGQRVGRLLAGLGADVRIGSRQPARASAACDAIRAALPAARLEAAGTASQEDVAKALEGRDLVIATGAAGIVLLSRPVRLACPQLRVAIDLNAVPPAGVEGVEVTDKGELHDGVLGYGAIGVGETKMKIHKAAIARLFASHDQVLDAEGIYGLALQPG